MSIKKAVERIINRDIKEISKLKLNDLGIFIEFNENNILNAKAIIIGPKDTPYENGILYFNILFPNDYPFNPPKVTYFSTSRVRIHPNLYVGKSRDNYNGKVCLSSINTWSGPKWTPIMHIGSVLLSIQSLLTENPIHNEPGYEKERGIINETYNKIVEYDNFNYLILNNGFYIHKDFQIFQDIIQKHLSNNKKNILNNIKLLSEKEKNKMKVYFNTYMISLIIDYTELYNKINHEFIKL